MKNSVTSENVYSNKDIALNGGIAEDVEALYRLVAGFEIINQIHKRKLVGLNYKYGNGIKTKLNDTQVKELYCKDKIYWDFAIREKGNADLYLDSRLDIYANQLDYSNLKVKYSVSYSEGVYSIFEVIKNRKKQMCKSEDTMSIINWIVATNNLTNKEDRDYFLNKLGIDKKLQFKLTQPYVNDIGLDVMIALSGDGIRFELMNKLAQFKELCECSEDIKSVDYLIDAGVELEVSIIIVYADGSNKILKFNNSEEGNEYSNVNECLDINKTKGGQDAEDVKKKLDKVIKLIEKTNLIEEGLSDTELLFKEGYLDIVDYTNYGELIIKMCEYDLLIRVDELGLYSINKAVMLSGVPVSMFEVNKMSCEKELVKWLFSIKKSEVTNFDYLSF